MSKNLWTNADLETDVDDWNNDNDCPVTWSTDYAWEQTHSLKGVCGAWGRAKTDTKSIVTGSTQYTASLYIYPLATNNINVTVYDQAATWLAADFGSRTGSTWNRVSVTFTTGSGSTGIYIIVEPAGSSVTFYIDAVQVELGSSATGWVNYSDSDDLEASDIVTGAPTLGSPESSGAGVSYYVRADGTAANKEAATSDADASTSMSLDKCNDETFVAGDTIVISDEGGTYRSYNGILCTDSGKAGSPITFRANVGGTPVLAGELVSGWTNFSGNIWQAALVRDNVNPNFVFINGSLGDKRSGTGDMSGNLDWYWAADVLYLYSSGGDPDTAYTSPGIETHIDNPYDSRFSLMSGVDYVTIDGITFKHGTFAGIGRDSSGASSNVTIKNCICEWNGSNGVDFNNVTAGTDSWIIEDCILRYNGEWGLLANKNVTNSIVRRNEVYENAKYVLYGAGSGWWIGGIKFWGADVYGNGNLIEENHVYSNGLVSGGDSAQGIGIWLDGSVASQGNEFVVRRNCVHDNMCMGIYIEMSQYSITHNNLCYNNAQGSSGDECAEIGMAITVPGKVSKNNLVYNNTCYAGTGWEGLRADNYTPAGAGEFSDNIFKNNIIIGGNGPALRANHGADNDGTNGSGNVYTYNCLGAEASGFVIWDEGSKATYDAWETAYGGTTNSIESDPLLANVGSDQYWLQDGSPCIDAGVNLGSPYNFGLQPSSTWPDAVATAEQGIFGSGWEIGAYVYPPTGGAVGDDTRHSRWFHLLTRRGHG